MYGFMVVDRNAIQTPFYTYGGTATTAPLMRGSVLLKKLTKYPLVKKGVLVRRSTF